MEGSKTNVTKKALGLAGQVLVVAVGAMLGIWALEQMRKPRIAPPAQTAAPAQA